MNDTAAAPSPRWWHRISFPLVVLVGGFGFSAAINIMATLPDPRLVTGGIMASLALPAAIHLWPMVPLHAGGADWQRWLFRVGRAAVMTGIAAMAGYITFRHGAQIMIPTGTTNGWDLATGYLYTLITESLVVLGVMAHRAPVARDVPTRLGATPRRAKETPPSVGTLPVQDATPAPAQGLRAVESVRDRVHAEYLATARRTLAEGGTLDDIVLAQVDERARASKGYAKKCVNGPTAFWRAELEAELAEEAVS